MRRDIASWLISFSRTAKLSSTIQSPAISRSPAARGAASAGAAAAAREAASRREATAAGRDDGEAADRCGALRFQVDGRLLVPRRACQTPLGQRIADQVGHDENERRYWPDDHQGKQRPEG